MLVAESLCWRLFLLCWWFSQCIKSATNISNLSPIHLVSNIRHQHRCNLAILVTEFGCRWHFWWHPDKEAARGIENNEHLIYHPGLSSTKSAKKFGCFGILSGKPLQTIAPFELYDDIKHKQSQDFRNSTLGIVDVTIIPVKSMIQLDQKQILGGIPYDIE